MSARPECPKCGGPEVSVAELSFAIPTPDIDAWRAKLKKTDRLLCARCLTGRTGSPSEVAAAMDADCEGETPAWTIRREQACEAHKRAKYERAMRGEW